MSVPMVDLKAQYNSIKVEIDLAMARVIGGSDFILGAEVKAFEEAMANYLGVNHGIGVASGTDALRLALTACDIGPGDEVITTPFTFIAPAEAITQCGATPVFVDIDSRTYNLDVSQVEARISNRTRAILPVHLYGQPVAMDPVLELARSYHLKVIEDCAQALGAKYQGRKVGSLGDIACLSFFPSKVLGAYGDGGMVVTNSPNLAERFRMLRNHGSTEKYHHLAPGFNSRLDSLQAAILRVKLKHLDSWISQRRKKAETYSRLLSSTDRIEPPHVAPSVFHNFNYYTIRLRNSGTERDELRSRLSSKGIASAIYYPLSLHLQPVYAHLSYQPGDFPESELAQDQVLSLPIYPEIREEQIEEIVNEIRSVIN